MADENEPPASPTRSVAADKPLASASTKAKSGDHDGALAEIQSYLAPYSKQNVSVEAVQAAAVAVRLCNELALFCMREASEANQLDASYAYLKWALKAPHASPALRAVTLNNAGIYYARTGQPQAALRCLERVGKQGGVVVEDDVSVHVMLNMTTVLADLGRHDEALEMAQEAVRTLTRAERAGKTTDSSLLSAAYHNLAVQQERLGSSKGHVRSYRAAMLQARKSGQKNPMQNFMEQAYSHARQRATDPPTPGDSSSARTNTTSSLPPLGKKGGGGGGAAKLSASRGSAASSGKPTYGSSLGRRPQQQRQKPSAGGAYVSLDDVYQGNVPASTVPIGAVGGATPTIIPPPGTDGEGGTRHAPRSAGSARISAAPAEEP